MKCANHHKVNASGACVECGKFFCSDCLVKSGRKNYCKECINERLAEPESNGNIVITQNNSQQVNVGKPDLIVPNPSTAGRVIRWIVSIIFAILAIGSFVDGSGWVGLASTFVFLLWLPSLEEPLAKKGLLMPLWMRILLTFLILVFISYGAS